MWYLRALAVAAVAVPLAVGTGCSTVSKAKYDKDVMAAQRKTDALQKQLDQVKKDLKAAQEQLKSKDQVVADGKAAQKQATDEKARADRLQSQLEDAQKALDQAASDLRAATAKVDKLQGELNEQKAGARDVAALKGQLAAKDAELTAAKKALAEIAKKLEVAMPETTPGK
jgi:putative ABC transport system permease protein